MLNGQKLQGPPTATEVNAVLRQKGMEDRYDITCTHSGVKGPSPWSGVNRCDAGTRYDIMLHTQWGRGSKPVVRSQQV